ncbi:hypothetical protein Afil01_31430 [Actinorhabdospora filicis]|uniref:TrbC/VIRB2 family protein n=1 Tax=Actinorhabdospora filicis TaxID=1785913 RepID=A0A9W6WA84_9ACTN|nr:hypothetical protein [Actinorhabdospora filicis]GLZ78336.1 hypothetical protein Afil01_31430 [Actinorhabdospora filicis]
MSSSAPARRSRLDRAVTVVLVVLLAVPMVLALTGRADAALADPPPGYAESDEAQKTLLAVIANIRNVIVGLLAALATLLLTIAGVRYLMGGGDPGQAEKAKAGLRAAAVGYGLAILAPALAALLSYVVTFR